MKRLATTLLLIVSLSALGQTIYMPSFRPYSPKVSAQGFSTTASVTGFDALFANPAAFSIAPTEITPLSFNTTGYLPCFNW